MARTKTPTKKIKADFGHDRIVLTATYTSGGSFRFSIGHTGERLTWGGSPDPAVYKVQMKTFMAAAKFRQGESNRNRIERLAAVAEQANDMAELVALLAK